MRIVWDMDTPGYVAAEFVELTAEEKAVLDYVGCAMRGGFTVLEIYGDGSHTKDSMGPVHKTKAEAIAALEKNVAFFQGILDNESVFQQILYRQKDRIEHENLFRIWKQMETRVRESTVALMRYVDLRLAVKHLRLPKKYAKIVALTKSFDTQLAAEVIQSIRTGRLTMEFIRAVAENKDLETDRIVTPMPKVLPEKGTHTPRRFRSDPGL